MPIVSGIWLMVMVCELKPAPKLFMVTIFTIKLVHELVDDSLLLSLHWNGERLFSMPYCSQNREGMKST